MARRTPAKDKAAQVAELFKDERLDYNYLKDVFRHLRQQLHVTIPKQPQKLPYVPTDEEISRLYDQIWKARRPQDMIMIKTMLYTGVRVAELVDIRLIDVDLDSCQIRVNAGKGNKDRVVPYPKAFQETLAVHATNMRSKQATYLFETSRQGPYSTRGVNRLLQRYTQQAGIEHSISPHKLRHYLFTWLKKQGVDDALIQPYSGHASRRSLEIYSKLSLADAQDQYDNTIDKFPI